MAIVVRQVAGRPDRFEPRMTRKGPRGYESLTRPRKEIKLQMLKRARKIISAIRRLHQSAFEFIRPGMPFTLENAHRSVSGFG